MRTEKNKAWVCLILSGLTEVLWAYFMKESHGFTKLLPSVLMLVFLIIGFVLLERAIRQFGIGMSYAVFTGIGIVGATIAGIVAFEEGISIIKILSVAVLLAGVIGLRFCGETEEKQR
ncbi:multidrug efflux SMR transporter [bacterium 210820-DFI.6.37]|nr:multidrug efflux SMR transporter [bacterium 210820-DFI.6.37]